MDKVAKGQRVRITGNEIFGFMGHETVTGEVFIVYPDGHGFGFKCDQTGSMETCDFGDGQIEAA